MNSDIDAFFKKSES
nr:unnamed protein product [Callosobruchus chinensis]